MVRLTLDWIGDPPERGQFLKTPRGRTAYEVVALTHVNRRVGSRGMERYKLQCERWQPTEVPSGATVHEFFWNKR